MHTRLCTLLTGLAVGMASLAPVDAQANEHAGNLITVQYNSFTVWLDCDTRSAQLWQYTIGKDPGNHKRHDDFYLDPNIPSECQQKQTGTYKTPKGVTKYHRGHLVPANVMDGDPLDIAQSNIMTNVLPMVAQMNTGAWYQTELFTECRRDRHQMTVYGGTYRGNMPPHGDFTASHGVVAPEAYWKVVTWKDNAIAWWIPNSAQATATRVDSYLISVREIESLVDTEIPVPEDLKDKVAKKTSAKTAKCNWG